VATCGAAALFLTSSAAQPAPGRAARPGFTVSVAPMQPPGIVGVSYPPKPYPTVSFCRPLPKTGATCGAYAFKVAKQPGKLPPGLSVATNGVVSGTPSWLSDLAKPPGSTAPGLFQFLVCAKAAGKAKKTLCKPTKLAVFTGLGGTWTGDYQGDSGAFTCNFPLSGSVRLVLVQKVSYANGTPKSTVAGTATFTNMPPISADGVQTGDCKMSTQSFGVTGDVTNPGVAGPNSANGLWNANVDAEGRLTGTLTVQDTGNNGFYSQLSFTVSRKPG
jgi:hypothetical protein